jgi:hypothetical protein
MRMRVYDLANELDVSSGKLVKKAKELGLPVSSHMQTLEPEHVLKLRSQYPQEEKMTRPWDADNNPWSLDMLRLRKKRKGFRQRFVIEENIQRFLDQGWQLADIKHYGGVAAKLPGEEGKTDTCVRRRDLILMELPEELGKKRDEYINYKTNIKRQQIVEKTKREIEQTERQLGGSARAEFDSDPEPTRQVIET